MTGAYPDLEARIPLALDGQAADSRESGRFCSKATLGKLWDAGVREEQFGGGIWAVDPTGGTSLAGFQLSVFRAPGLTAQLMADEYKSGAGATSRVTIVSATNEQVNGRPGFRINLLNGDSHQAIVIWPSNMPISRGVAAPYGIRRATGCPERAMTISSPASTAARSDESCVFASWTLTVRIVAIMT